MNDVVVTGMGVVAPIGVGTAEFARQMFAGASGIVDIRGRRVAPAFPIRAAGLVSEDKPVCPNVLRRFSPDRIPASIRYSATAVEQAMDALPPGLSIDAVLFSSSDGVDFELIREFSRSLNPMTFPWESTRSENCLDTIRQVVQQGGNGAVPEHRAVNIYNACISSAQSIGIALQRIRSGEWTRVLVGGVDARCNEPTLMDFHLLNALSTDGPECASRPFSRGRNGFVLAEGAAALILESKDAAVARQAKIRALVTGYAATSDAYRLTDGRPDAAAATRAITAAISDARRTPREIDAVSAHGTSTPLNDRLETKALKQALGEHAYRIPVTSLKSQIGHTTVASAAIQAVASILMLEQNRVAPTINYTGQDPECDLDYVPASSREANLRIVLSNSFGFGGQNGSLVFEKAEV